MCGGRPGLQDAHVHVIRCGVQSFKVLGLGPGPGIRYRAQRSSGEKDRTSCRQYTETAGITEDDYLPRRGCLQQIPPLRSPILRALNPLVSVVSLEIFFLQFLLLYDPNELFAVFSLG